MKLFGLDVRKAKGEKEETAIAKRAVQKVDEETIRDYIFNSGLRQKITKEQENLAIATALAYNLNPIKKEIHFVPYFNKVTGKHDISLITGYEVYIKRAERSGDLEYWNVKEQGQVSLEKPFSSDYSATVTIKRKSHAQPFAWTIYFREVVKVIKPKSGSAYIAKMWKTQPRFQCKKCAISQAFRLCFSDELGGMLYDEAELPPKGIIDITPQPEEKKKEEDGLLDPNRKPPETAQPTHPTQKPEFIDLEPTPESEPHGVKYEGEEEGIEGEEEVSPEGQMKCVRCGGEMKRSQFNKDKTVEEYYCSNYKALNCKERFKIKIDTGEIIRAANGSANGKKETKAKEAEKGPEPTKEAFIELVKFFGPTKSLEYFKAQMQARYRTTEFDRLKPHEKTEFYKWISIQKK